MESYCKVYIDTSLNNDEILSLIQRIIGGTIWLRTIESEGCIVHLFANPEANPDEAVRGREGFLAFPFYLDVDIELDNEVLITEKILSLLGGLWSNNISTVCSCFPGVLPFNGERYFR